VDIDKNTIKNVIYFNIIAFLLSIITFIYKNNCVWFEFASNLFLGLFSSGVLVLFVSIISAQSIFKKSVNNILFYSRKVKNYYDEIFYIDRKRFLTVSKRIIECYEEFYKNYQDIEYTWFNQKYKGRTQNLFNTFTTFVSPFYSSINKYEISDITEKDIDQFFLESKTMTKVKFDEFVRAYVDLYSLFDKKMLASVLQWDENSLDIHNWTDNQVKHQSIRQIINQK
jgi:hypothetical protein